MQKIKAENIESSFQLLGGYEQISECTPVRVDELLLLSDLEIVPVCTEAIVIPKGTSLDPHQSDEVLQKSIQLLHETYTLVHPAYLTQARNYTHIFDELYKARVPDIGDLHDQYGPWIRFDGCTYARISTAEYYGSRPQVLSLSRGERGHYSVRMAGNLFTVCHSDALVQLAKSYGIEYPSDTTQDVYISTQFTCVIKK